MYTDHVIGICSRTASVVSAEGTAHIGGEMVGKIRNVIVAFHAEMFFCWLARRTRWWPFVRRLISINIYESLLCILF